MMMEKLLEDVSQKRLVKVYLYLLLPLNFNEEMPELDTGLFDQDFTLADSLMKLSQKLLFRVTLVKQTGQTFSRFESQKKFPDGKLKHFDCSFHA